MLDKDDNINSNEIEMAKNETYRAHSTYQRIWDYLVKEIENKIDNGVPRSHIAKDLGVSNSTITRWLSKERGVENARFMDAIRIANYLDIDDKTIRDHLSKNELKAFTLISQLKNGKGLLLLRRIFEYANAKGKRTYSESLDNTIGFNHEFLNNLAPEADQHFLFTVRSNKMHPTLSHGDSVMIAPADKVIDNQKIYAVKINGRTLIARISLENDELILKYDSPNESDESLDLTKKNTELIGRVVWMSRAL
jgi:transcriptional regulator with XRE-family HTH domain